MKKIERILNKAVMSFTEYQDILKADEERQKRQRALTRERMRRLRVRRALNKGAQ